MIFFHLSWDDNHLIAEKLDVTELQFLFGNFMSGTGLCWTPGLNFPTVVLRAKAPAFLHYIKTPFHRLIVGHNKNLAS